MRQLGTLNDHYKGLLTLLRLKESLRKRKTWASSAGPAFLESQKQLGTALRAPPSHEDQGDPS